MDTEEIKAEETEQLTDEERLEARLVDAVEVDAFFAADLQPTERLDWPKMPGCWVQLRPMDGAACDEYESKGRRYSIPLDKSKAMTDVPVEMQQRARNEYLVSRTVVDYLIKQRRPDGVLQDLPMGEGLSERDRIARIEKVLCGKGGKGLARGHWNWLVYQCLKINGLTDDQGNA